MTPVLKKLLGEFRQMKGKLLLCILATAVSAWGISSVFYGYLMAERDFKVNFGETRRADIVITIDQYSAAIGEKLLDDDAVLDVERREMVSSRIKNSKGVWMTLLLFGCEDISKPRMDRFEITDGSIKSDNFIFIERNANDFLDYYSDTAIVELGKEKKRVAFFKAGIVHDAGQAPAQMERVVYGYTLNKTIDSLLQPQRIRLLVGVKGHDHSMQSLQVIADRLKVTAAASGGKVAAIQIPTPGKHVHQPIIDGISFLQMSFGAVLIVLGITLLSLILLTWLFPQLVQIAIMKAVGASTRQIQFGFLSALLIIISFGLVIGLPLGFRSAILFNKFIALLQNFDVVDEPFPWYVHIEVLLVSSIIPFLFGMAPINQVSRTKVQHTLTTTFEIQSVGLLRFLRTMMGHARSRYAFGNLLRSRYRALFLMALMAIGTGLFFTGFNLSYSFRSDFENFYRGSNYEATIFLSDTTRQRLTFLESLTTVKSVSYIRAQRLSYEVPDLNKIETASVRIYEPGYDLNQDLIVVGKVDRTCENCVYVHPSMVGSGFSSVNFGDTLVLTGNTGEFKAIYSGVLKDVGGVHGGGSMTFFSTVKNPWFSIVAVDLKSGVRMNQALIELEAALKKHDIKYNTISDVETSLEGAYNHFLPTYLIVEGMGLFTIVLSFFGIIIVLNLTIQERTMEIGIVKALGGTSADMGWLFAVEFAGISCVALGIGFLLSTGTTGFLCRLYGEMVRGQAIPPLNNYFVIFMTTILLLVLQASLIFLHSRSRIRRTSIALLNYLG